MSEENTIYIGKKSTMNYVMACFTVLQTNPKKLILKARGRSISKAVDVLEILKNRFIKDKIDKINITTGTDNITSESGGTFNMSTIEIEVILKK
ncbi:MAG: DNA-binding protein Alba [Candidatus Helarchaeota archaeon]